LTQEEAARLLGVCSRTFRRYINRYEENGLEGLLDKRLTQISSRRAPVNEVMAIVDNSKLPAKCRWKCVLCEMF
jgi:transposase